MMVSEAGFEPARPVKWALAPQASVSAVPPLRRMFQLICWGMLRCAAGIILPERPAYASTFFSYFLPDRTLRIKNHQTDERKEEHHGKNDSNAIEILLHHARTGMIVVHLTGDHIAHAGPFTRMQKDEDDQADAGEYQQHGEDDCDDRQRSPLPGLYTRIHETVIIETLTHLCKGHAFIARVNHGEFHPFVILYRVRIRPVLSLIQCHTPTL